MLAGLPNLSLSEELLPTDAEAIPKAVLQRGKLVKAIPVIRTNKTRINEDNLT